MAPSDAVHAVYDFQYRCVVFVRWLLFWPNEQQRYLEYTEIKDELVETGQIEAEVEHEDSATLQLAWKRHSEAQGYNGKTPKEREDGAISEQRVIGWVLLFGATCHAIWIAWNHKLRIRAEGEVVIGASGQRVELDSIVKIDRKKWENKGIAYAIYEVDGKQKRLCLDDHKFAGTEQIILEAERRIEARKEA